MKIKDTVTYEKGKESIINDMNNVGFNKWIIAVTFSLFITEVAYSTMIHFLTKELNYETN